MLGVTENGAANAAGAITGVVDPIGTAERLSRSLSAVIEPAQTNVSLRPLEDPKRPNRGIIVIRVQASLRAPHRSTRSKECYTRRGTESVPMAMDEIQDLTLFRTMLRQEREELLSRQFEDFEDGRIDHIWLAAEIAHFRVVVLPFVDKQMKLESEILSALALMMCQFTFLAIVGVSTMISPSEVSAGVGGHS